MKDFSKEKIYGIVGTVLFHAFLALLLFLLVMNEPEIEKREKFIELSPEEDPELEKFNKEVEKILQSSGARNNNTKPKPAPGAPKELKSTNTEPVERPAEPAKITSEEKSVPEPVREVDEQAELNAEMADIFNKSGNIKKPEEEPVMDPGVHTDPTPGSGNSVSVSFGDGKGRGYTKAPYNGAVPQEGTIVVEVTVSPEGKVIGEPRIASGSDIADNAFRRRVLENAKKFKFDSANRPDNQVATITYKFTVK